ncbi:MAG: methylase involved in ubiquinone/menaquinone biosynthesis [bacterium]|nr:methylase involved in ubiquinone/menaquinone biosynthesis [bacterium]
MVNDLKLDLRNEPLPSGPGMLELMTAGYLMSSVLFTAVELALFDALAEEPRDAASLAARLDASPEGVRRLLSALCAFGLCRRDGDGRFANSELATAALTSGAPGSIVPTVLHHRRHLFDLFARLTDGVRSGEPQLEAWRFAGGDTTGSCYDVLARHPEELALLMRALNSSAVGVGRAIAGQIDLTAARELIDLGGGGAQVAVELAQALPSLSIVIVDSAATCRLAQARVEAAGLARRIRCVAADLRRPLDDRVAPADAVLLSGVLSDFPPAERDQVLRNAAAVVAPRGRLLVSETLLNATRTGPALPALLSLFMLLSTRGDNFAPDELRRHLAAVGFGRVEIHFNGPRGLRDLVVAERGVVGHC